MVPEEDIDGLVEGLLARVGLDGMEERDPLAVILLLRWRPVVLPWGEFHGIINAEERTVAVDVMGSSDQVTRTWIHECGHVVQCELGVELPHCEILTSAFGRAVAAGRDGVLRRLDRLSTREVIASYAGVLPPCDAAYRVWEVQRSVARLRAGLLGGRNERRVWAAVAPLRQRRAPGLLGPARGRRLAGDEHLAARLAGLERSFRADRAAPHVAPR